MRTFVLIAAAAAVVMVAATWTLIGGRSSSERDKRPPGLETAVLVERYLAALERKDGPALRALAPPGYDTRTDIELRIAVYGGLRRGAVTSVTSDISPEVATLQIHAIDTDGEPLLWTENLVRGSRGWFLLLGLAPRRGDEPPRSSTARPASPGPEK